MFTVKPLKNVKKTVYVPADKSISHRAVMLSSLCKSRTVINPFLLSDDTRATIESIKKLGAKIKIRRDGSIIVKGTGLHFPKRKKVNLYAAESGTTMRILTGLLCGQKFSVCFTAAPSLRRRPMGRIVLPLSKMNADISGVSKGSNIYPPLSIAPSKRIKGGNFKLMIASAQVKSALMLASLYADSKTTITEPFQSRDHTERMLKLFNAKLTKKGRTVVSYPVKSLSSPGKLFIPSDFSSAAFFVVLGLILKGSELTIKNVNINPTRCGLLKVLKRMGADIKVLNKTSCYEPYADLRVKTSQLKSTEVSSGEIPLMIDEIPILCVAAAFARGKTIIKGVKELKVKETDRLNSMIYNLRKAGVNINAKKYRVGNKKTWDWQISVGGGKKHRSAKFKSFGDHRTAMSLIVFAMASDEGARLDDIKCINKSFPEFTSIIHSLRDR